jgi:LuxR family transcriptional regulator, maltose regulon positive regulatory protein
MADDISSEPLIKTKLCTPQPRSRLVTRSGLLAQLEEGSQRALTLLCAPAGYGKTTLLAEFIAERAKSEELPSSFCWVSLDEGDNDPVRFLAYLVQALDKARPGTGAQASTLLHSFPPPPGRSILTLLINDLHALASPIFLVLDDYQFISNPAIHDGIVFLLDHLPANLHLIIATRSDPPLPLARLRGHNRLLELRAQDLRFTSAEAADFLHQVMHLPLSAQEIDTLENRTEGWIAGLQMAAVSMQGRSDTAGFIQAFSGSHRYILDYLTGEALDGQPAEIRVFLLQTSILGRFCAALCAAVLGLGEPAARASLAYLDRANLFLVALDDEYCWFRYHHLFADLLQARLKQSRPDQVNRLHARASEWFEQNGYTIEAIQHAFSAQDYERAGELIERYGPANWSRSDPSILSLAINLPPQMLLKRPRLGLYQAWIWIAQGQVRSASSLLRELSEHLPAGSPEPEQRWMRTVLDLLWSYTHITGKDALLPLPDIEALERMPAQDLGLHNTADTLSAFLLCRRGEFEAAGEILHRSVERDFAGSGSTAIPMAIPFLARIRLMQGKLHAAANLCREYLEPGTQRGKAFSYTGGSLNIVLGETLREWNDLAEAEAQIQTGLRLNEPWHNLLTDVIGYSALTRVQEAQGDLEAAFETMRRLEEMLQGRTRPPDQEDELRALKVRLWLAKGDLASAGAWADQLGLGDPNDPRHELDCISLARVRIAQERYAEAHSILENLVQVKDEEKRSNRQMKIDLLLGVALAGQKRFPEAFQALESCLSLAEPEGYMRLFLDTGGPLQELLNAYLRTNHSIYRAFVQKILAGFSSHALASPAEIARAGLTEPLTARELEVLSWMVEGLSNRQIADQLILSEGTIKFHVHSILGKIQVHSRTEAIARARKLDLA